MTTAAHTPGPWTYQYSPYTSQDGREIPAFEVHGEEKVCDTNENRPSDEQEANARLIATAPELFSALEFFFNIMHDYPCSVRKPQQQSQVIAAPYDHTGRQATSTLNSPPTAAGQQHQETAGGYKRPLEASLERACKVVG